MAAGSKIQNSNIIRNILRFLCSYATAIVAYCIDVIFIWRMGPRDLDSDMASEMILSDILNKEASISGLTKNWIYSTEIRVFHMQWFYRIGLLFFPNNWSVARTMGMAISLLAFALCIFLLFYSIGSVRIAPFAITLCLLPGGSWYFWQTLLGGQYLPYILISIVVTSLILLFHNKEKHRWIYIVGIIIISLLSGLNGIKQLMVFYAPLVLASCGILLYTFRKEGDASWLHNKKNWDYVNLSVIAAISSFIGFIINSNILAKEYYFASYNNTLLQGGNFWNLVRGYLWSFGYSDNKILMSFAGIASIMGLVIGVITLVSGFILIKRFAQLSLEQKYLTVISMVSIAFNVFIFTYANGGMQYYQPIVPFSLMLIVLCIDTGHYVVPNGKAFVIGAIVCLELVTSIGTMQSEFDGPLHDERLQVGMEGVVDWLKAMDYKNGIAEFWQGNIVTELSDGEIEMWVINGNGSYEVFRWLQATDHCDSLPQDDYFLLTLSGTDYSSFLEDHPELSLVYGDENYYIYGTR